MSWLFGIDGFRISAKQKVFWHGVEVDRISTSIAPHTQEQSLRELAMACQTLEAQGKEVSQKNIFSLWDRVRWACDVPGAPKWAVFYASTRASRLLKVLYLGNAQDPAQIQNALESTRDFLGHERTYMCNQIFCLPVATQEELLQAQRTIRHEFEKAKCIWNTSEEELEAEEKSVFESLNSTIERESLPTEVDAKRATYGAWWDAYAATADEPQQISGKQPKMFG